MAIEGGMSRNPYNCLFLVVLLAVALSVPLGASQPQSQQVAATPKQAGSPAPATPPETPTSEAPARLQLLDPLYKVVGVAGGLVGLVGGLFAIFSRFQPARIVVTHRNRLGVVVSVDGTTSKVHLPLVFTNVSKKPGVVRDLQLQMRRPDGSEVRTYRWGLTWRETDDGDRVPDHNPAAIPVPGLAGVERNLQFDSSDRITWQPTTYEFCLDVWQGARRRSRRVARFYARPSAQRIGRWYSGPHPTGPWVDDFDTFEDRSDVPPEGT